MRAPFGWLHFRVKVIAIAQFWFRTEGPVSGYRLSGRWSFASGCDLAEWGELGAMIVPSDAASPLVHDGPVRAFEGAFFPVPAAD
jgi:hypothetical protein